MKAFKKIYKLFTNNLELIFWVSGFTYLSLFSPEHNHFSFCPLKQLGFSWCPGCGLGKSISMILRLDIIQSFKFHPLGAFAITIIILRIVQIIKNNRREKYG